MGECECCGQPISTNGRFCDGCNHDEPLNTERCDLSMAWHCPIGYCDGSDCTCQAREGNG